MFGERPLEPRGRRGGAGVREPTLGLPGCPAPPLSCHVLSWVDLAQLLSYLQVNCVTFLEASVWKLEKSVTVSS